MGIKEIDNDLINFAVEMYFNGEHLISLEKENSDYIIKTRQLPIEN